MSEETEEKVADKVPTHEPVKVVELKLPEKERKQFAIADTIIVVCMIAIAAGYLWSVYKLSKVANG